MLKNSGRLTEEKLVDSASNLRSLATYKWVRLMWEMEQVYVRRGEVPGMSFAQYYRIASKGCSDVPWTEDRSLRKKTKRNKANVLHYKARVGAGRKSKEPRS